jgi:Prophage minor tail protein Z (GPZ)
MARLKTRARVDNRAVMARIASRLDGLSESMLDKYASRALVSVRRKAAPIAKREIRNEYGVQSSALNSAFDALTGSDTNGAYVALAATVGPISLIRFAARWSRRSKGASAEIVRGQRKTYEAAFIAPMKNGQKHVMARERTSGGRRVARLPIVRLTGPSAYQMAQGRDGETSARINEQLAAFASDELLRQLQLVRKGKGRR